MDVALNILIKPAEITDIPGILTIVEQNLIRNKQQHDLAQLAMGGFLVNPITSAELTTAILHPELNIILIAKQNIEIMGYTAGHALELWRKQDIHWDSHVRVSPQIQKILTTEKILYHRHIARKINTKGIGLKLMQILLEQAKTRQYRYIVCKIVHHPWHNAVSIKFHEQLGFFLAGTGNEENFDFGLYLKKLS